MFVFWSLFLPPGPPKNSCRLQCGAVLRFFWNRCIKVLFRKNSSPPRWGAVFLQYCRPLPAIFNVFASHWWLKINSFPFVFNTFESWLIFVGVVRRSSGRSCKNSNLKKQLAIAAPSCLNLTFLHLFLQNVSTNHQNWYTSSYYATEKANISFYYSCHLCKCAIRHPIVFDW